MQNTKDNVRSMQNTSANHVLSSQSNTDEECEEHTHGRRYAVQNFDQNDVQKLLHIVADVEPIGHNGEAKVKHAFDDYWKWNDGPFPSIESLRNKFNRLIYVSKKSRSHMSCASTKSKTYSKRHYVQTAWNGI